MLVFAEKNVTCMKFMNLMIRTFHSKINKVTLFCCLLPATVLAVYFFWVKMPLAALVFMLLVVVVIERLIHTSYIFTDDGMLWIDKGRFSKKTRIALTDIREAEVVRTSAISLLKNRETVMLTMQDGSMRFVAPFPAEDFCRYLNHRKENGK